MIWKETIPLVVIVISLSFPSSIAKEEPTDEDIDETSILVVNYVGPLLELNGYTIDDLPNHLKYLTSKYYLIFSRGIEPLDTLEQMVSDYEIIRPSQSKVADIFEEYTEHFVRINSSDNKKALEKFVDKMMKFVDFHLEVVSDRDALKFLLYQEAYPDIMKILGLMVTKHYDAYPSNEQPANETHQSSSSSLHNESDNDFDLSSMVRGFVATHGRLELVKRLLNHLESYLPPFDPSTLSDSTLDYLDDLKDLLETKTYSLWRFIKGSTYKTATDEWIAVAEDFLTDLFTNVPFQEILNFIDAVALNSNNRKALIALRYERSLRSNDELSNSHTNFQAAENFNDVLNAFSNTVVNGLASTRDIVRDTVIKAYGEISENAFLEYIDELLAPHDMTTDELSKDLRSIISRTFTRINSFEGQSLNDLEKQTLEMEVRTFRKNLAKLRDSIGILIPVQSEPNHIELDILLQSLVNKFGPFVSAMEEVVVNVFNSLVENPNDKKLLDAKISGFTEELNTLDSIFKSSGKRPSELLQERLSELVEMIEGFVDFTSF